MKKERISDNKKIKEKEEDFYNYVNIDEVTEKFQVDRSDIELIFHYWKLKRKANNNRPLLTPKVNNENPCDEDTSSTSFAIQKRIIHLRHELERARNLCYMICKREKMNQRWVAIKEKIFLKQNSILSTLGKLLTESEKATVLNANVGDIAFDKKYTGKNGPNPNVSSVLTSLIGKEGIKQPVNGLLKNQLPKKKVKSERSPNPYAKHYLNGLAKRNQRWFPLEDKQKKKAQRGSISQKRLSTNSNISNATSDDGSISLNDKESDVATDAFSPKGSNDVADSLMDASDSISVSSEVIYDVNCVADGSVDNFSSLEISSVHDDLQHFNSEDVYVCPIELEVSTEPDCATYDIIQSCTEPDLAVVKEECVDSSDNLTFCNGFKFADAVSPHCSREGDMEVNSSSKKKRIEEKSSSHSKNKPCINSPRHKSNKSSFHKTGNNFKTSLGTVSEVDEENGDNSEVSISKEPPSSPAVNAADSIKNETVKLEHQSNIKSVPTDETADTKKSQDINLIDVKSIIGRTCLKVSLERNLELQMERNCVKLPQPIVVLKSEDIVNCIKSGMVPSKSICAEVKSEANNKQPSAMRTDTASSNSQDCDINSSISHSVCEELPEAKSHTVQSRQSAKPVQKPSAADSDSEKSKPLPHEKSSPPQRSPAPKTKPPAPSVHKSPSSPSVKHQEKSAQEDPKDKPSESVVLPKKDMLRGYKIPKKTSSKPVVNSLDLKRGSSPLSPLPDITTSGLSSYQTNAKSSWRKLESRTDKPPLPNTRPANGDSHPQPSERLVIKLKKDTSDPDSQRWQADNSGVFNRNRGFNYHHPPLLPPPLPPFTNPAALACMNNNSQWRPMRNRDAFVPPRMNFRARPYKT